MKKIEMDYYDIVVVVNELHAVMGGTDFEFEPTDILEKICEPLLKEWYENENEDYLYLSDFAVDWIELNIKRRV